MCVYKYVYVCAHIYVYVSVCANVGECMYVKSVHIRECMCVGVCICVHVYARICEWV